MKFSDLQLGTEVEVRASPTSNTRARDVVKRIVPYSRAIRGIKRDTKRATVAAEGFSYLFSEDTFNVSIGRIRLPGEFKIKVDFSAKPDDDFDGLTTAQAVELVRAALPVKRTPTKRQKQPRPRRLSREEWPALFFVGEGSDIYLSAEALQLIRDARGGRL